ncbi:MAG TPA: hypothetical protein PLJ84_05350 [Bacteroidales bacterium]|nr:hypothetical protein [Bacteroidales bacterium]HPT02004.1 hypothetical protein [Bacteroidales bacterium]
MRLYKTLVLILLASLAFACGPKKVIEEKYEDGSPKVVKYYEKVNGERQVVREQQFYANKNKKMEGEFTKMKRSGVWKAWYENGNLWSEGDFKDGKRDGMGKVYYENGKLYFEGNYSADNKVGIWRFYDANGKVIREVDYNKEKVLIE